jgi:hypothetical protein
MSIDQKAFPVLIRGSYLHQTVICQFSSSSHWLGIQNPPFEIWVKEEVIAYEGGCINEIIESRNRTQQYRPPPWCLPTTAWWCIAAKRNLLLRIDLSTGNVVRKFYTHLPKGTPCDLGKAVVLGRAKKMEKFCMKIISYPLFTHKEQMTTNMKKQGNVDLQLKKHCRQSSDCFS